jgi:hypothetical protein
MLHTPPAAVAPSRDPVAPQSRLNVRQLADLHRIEVEYFDADNVSRISVQLDDRMPPASVEWLARMTKVLGDRLPSLARDPAFPRPRLLP